MTPTFDCFFEAVDGSLDIISLGSLGGVSVGLLDGSLDVVSLGSLDGVSLGSLDGVSLGQR